MTATPSARGASEGDEAVLAAEMVPCTECGARLEFCACARIGALAEERDELLVEIARLHAREAMEARVRARKIVTDWERWRRDVRRAQPVALVELLELEKAILTALATSAPEGQR